VPERRAASEATLAADEEHILRCLGAALIMRWNTLQTELQRELFDDAGSMGALLETRNFESTNRSFPAQEHEWPRRDGKTSPQSEDETNSSGVSRLTR
jgi:hypothetical protein